VIKNERIILGIDPGTSISGYGLIRSVNNKPELIAMGIIDMSKIGDTYLKLKRIFERTLSLIDEFHPDEMALEAPFFGKNVQSMLKLGRAQGVAMAAGLYRSIPIAEYAPRKIKLAITGSGTASKKQVAVILKNQLKFKEIPKNLDATDGLAAAVCHFYQKNPSFGSKPSNSWSDFVKKNPQRVK